MSMATSSVCGNWLRKINAPVQLSVIKGAGHFFDDQLEELKAAITEWALRSDQP